MCTYKNSWTWTDRNKKNDKIWVNRIKYMNV